MNHTKGIRLSHPNMLYGTQKASRFCLKRVLSVNGMGSIPSKGKALFLPEELIISENLRNMERNFLQKLRMPISTEPLQEH